LEGIINIICAKSESKPEIVIKIKTVGPKSKRDERILLENKKDECGRFFF